MIGSASTARPSTLYVATLLFLVLLFLVGLMAGSQWVSPLQLLSAIDGTSGLLTRITVLELRLPRNLLGILGGAALGVAGAVMQGVTRNPLASPGLTGVIASAALAVVSLRTLSSPGAMWLPLMALGGGLLGGALTFAMISIDRSKVESVLIVGDLSEAQLISVKNQLEQLEMEPVHKAIREALMDLDWVFGANVRRRWPSGVSIEVVPGTVVAYWNDDGFINADGEMLVTDLLVGGDLPGLYGPDGTEQEVMARFQELGGILASHGIEIRNLRRTNLGSWTIETRNRITIILGKEDLKARIDRFLAINALLQNKGEAKRVTRMDARYINGVAVQFEDELNLGSALGDARNDINKSVGVLSL